VRYDSFHRHEAEHPRRLRAHVAAEFHKQAAALEDIERRFGDAIRWGDTCGNCRSE
jgi:hypothetical protein